jgi:hypothetical protein
MEVDALVEFLCGKDSKLPRNIIILEITYTLILVIIVNMALGYEVGSNARSTTGCYNWQPVQIDSSGNDDWVIGNVCTEVDNDNSFVPLVVQYLAW